MNTIIFALLLVVTISFISVTIVLVRKLRANSNSVKALITVARRMAGNQLTINQTSIKGSIDELESALQLIVKTIEDMADNLSLESERMSAILSSVESGVLVVDEDRQVTMLNDYSMKLFKVSRDVIGRPLISVIRDHEIDSLVQKCLAVNERQSGTVQIVSSKQYLKIIATPLKQGALILVLDLTNIRHLEQVRKDFVANISHELRTPIASQKALVETLLNGAISDKKVAKDFLNRMQVETDKLAQMVNELNELSSIESGDQPLVLAPVDLSELIKRVTERLKAQADRAQLNLAVDLTDKLPSIMAEKNKIEQVLVNIIHNAIKFTPRYGNIIISGKLKGEEVLVSVCDTGIGIPADDLPRVFERFYKVDKARSGGGTGLGLAIARHIIQAHGGNIWVESEEGKGSVFTFSLPVVGP